MYHVTASAPAERKPAWRRIVDFPLVAMLIGIAVIAAAIFVAVLIAQFLLPPIPGLTGEVKFDLACAPLLILVYKLTIRRLG
jgi:uncharacterized RDD family membrane protein YckC